MSKIGETCPVCLGVRGSVGCHEFRNPEPRARVVDKLNNATLDGELVVAKKEGRFVKAWRLHDGREVLNVRGELAVARLDSRPANALAGGCVGQAGRRLLAVG